MVRPEPGGLRLTALPAVQSKSGHGDCDKKDRRRFRNGGGRRRLVRSDQARAILVGDDLRARTGSVDGVSIIVEKLSDASENGACAVGCNGADDAVERGRQIQIEGIQECVPLSGLAGRTARDVACSRGHVYAATAVDVVDQGRLFRRRQVVTGEKNRLIGL